MFGTAAVVFVLWLLVCLQVIRAKDRSAAWQVLAALGPFGLAILAMLSDCASTKTDRYSRFVGNMKWFVRAAYELEEVVSQQQADGGWSLFPLARTWRDWSPSALFGNWKRSDGTPQERSCDGYATGLTLYVLQQAGVPRDNVQLKRSREWLVSNQNKTGYWLAYSLNKRRDLSSNVGRFMSDAATAYAALALAN